MIREIESAKYKDGVSYVREVVIGSGMALNLNGEWEVSQLCPHLQEILKT